MGQNEHDFSGRARAGMVLGILLLSVLILALGVGAGMMIRPRSSVEVKNREGGGSEDAPLPAGAVLIVGSAEVDVEGGILPLSPLSTGQIKAIRAHEGQMVTAGEPLIELDATLADGQIDLAAINLRYAELQGDLAEQSVKRHADLIKQQHYAIRVAELRYKIQNDQTAYAEKSFESKLINSTALESARDLLRMADQSLQSEKLALEQLESSDPQLSVRSAKVQIDLAARQLEIARQQRGYLTLKAPADGEVLRVVARQSQAWTGVSREPAIWFRPAHPWIVRCEVEQQYVSRIHTGMPCEIYDDRLDAPSWKGTVQSCSGWVGPRRASSDDPLARRDIRVIECVVALSNPDDRLRVGQRVRVVIKQQ